MRRAPNATAWALLAPVHLLILLVLALPSVYVFWLSLNNSSYGTSLEFVGLANYVKIFHSSYFWRALWNTVIVVNAIVYSELILGMGLALLFVRKIPFKALLLGVVLMPYAISEVVAVLMWKILMDPNVGAYSRTLQSLGLGLFNWSYSPALGLTLIAIVSVWHNLPFTFLLLYAGRLSIDGSLYEAAGMDGASSRQAFLHVTLPLLVPSILLALIFRLIFAFRIFSEVWLLTKGGPARLTEVLAVYLYDEGFRYGDFGVAGATGWVMVLGSVLLASFYLYKMHRRMV